MLNYQRVLSFLMITKPSCHWCIAIPGNQTWHWVPFPSFVGDFHIDQGFGLPSLIAGGYAGTLR